MVDGKKSDVQPGQEIHSPKNVVGLLFVAAVAGFVFYLQRNFEPSAGTLNLGGTLLQLTEKDDKRDEREHKTNKDGGDKEDDDGDDG
jgi:hypothetical protein